MDGRRRTDANRPVHRTRLTGRSPGTSILVGAPDRGRRAGVADGARLVHGAKRQGVLRAAEQAVDLDARPVAGGKDRYVTHAAAANPSPAGDRNALSPLDLVEGHRPSSPGGRR